MSTRQNEPNNMTSIINYSKDACIRTDVTGFGVPFQDITCLYPALGKITTHWENNYNVNTILIWMIGHPMVPIITAAMYLAVVAVGPMLMKQREAMNWRKSMAIWNLSISLFSAIGFTRVLPQLLHNYATAGVRHNFCADPLESYGQATTGLWVCLFVLSKFPELIDTFFLVVHKKPAIFLHWYHHVSVLLYCWNSYTVKTSTGLIFCTMNYAVHSIMYFYYFLVAVKKRPKGLNPMCITYVQIAQMFVGVAVTFFSIYYKSSDHENTCIGLSQQNNLAAFMMYCSYLFLFVQFFVRRYFAIRTKKLA